MTTADGGQLRAVVWQLFYFMPSPLETARHEVGRLRAICEKLPQLKLAPIKDETDQLQVLVWSMLRKLQPETPQPKMPVRSAGASRTPAGQSVAQISKLQ